jgi:hypothetical protein
MFRNSISIASRRSLMEDLAFAVKQNWVIKRNALVKEILLGGKTALFGGLVN